MTTLTKVLLGTAVVAGVGAIIAVASSKEEKQETVEVTSNDKVVQIPVKEEDKSLLERIKEAATKKALQILKFAVLHMEQIQAVSAIIGLGSGAIGIATAIRDFKRGNDLAEKVDQINDKLDWMQAFAVATNKAETHNEKVFAVTLEAICEKTDVDIDKLCTELSKIEH